MDANTPKAATLYQKRHRWNRTWKRITTVLASVVVFITTYALILPAITMEPAYICGKEAHVHTDACYQLAEPAQMTNLICTFDTLGIHTHTTECYNENSELMCGYADFVLHTHSNHCYNQNGELSCVLPEIEAHIHDERCWKQPHAHADTCYIQQRGELLCTVEEGSVHTHLDTCYTPQQNLICTVPETAPHTHITETCYTETRDLLCTEPEVAAHTHSDTCYTAVQTLTCTMEELEGHSHSDACYDENGTLICGLPEIVGHKHDDACYQSTSTFSCILEETAGHTHVGTCYSTPVSTLICTTEETEGHTHGTDCFETVGVVTCAFEENIPHTHTDACFLCTPVLQCTELTAEQGVAPVLSCQKEERMPHIHDASCLDGSGTCVCGRLELYEHIHEDICFVETVGSSGELVLICGCEVHEHTEECIPEEEAPTDTTLPDEEALIDGLYCGCAEHAHQDGCFNEEGTLMCTMTEHQHNWICELIPSDFSAVETSDDWEADLPELQGDLAADLIAVAESQLGYTENEENYIIEDDEQLFYSRYGAWWDEDDPYGDWNAKFISFCLYYAEAENYPALASCSAWVSELRHRELYELASDYLPNAGDIVFFDRNSDGRADRMGIVESVMDTDVSVIEGDRSGRVAQKTYELSDNSIIAYGALTEGQMSEEEPTLEDLIVPEDTDAWAVLVDSNGKLADETEPEETGLLRAGTEWGSTYSLRKTVSLFQTRANEPLNLTPYIIAVTMYDEDKKPLPDGSTVTEGDLIEFKIEYTITGQQLAVMNGQNITVKSDTLVYKLPATFKIVQSDSGYIFNSSGQQVGTYEINSETGYITMRFSEDYVKQNAEGLQIHGQISFFSTVTKVTDSESENQDHKFTDEITLGVVIQEKIEAVGDLSIEKEKVSVDGENITYEVTVTSANGTSGPVVITDQMSKGLTFATGIGAWDTNGNMIKNAAAFTPSADNSSFTLELPAMAAGDQYVVRYECKADVDLLDADMTVQNKASVTSTDSLGQPLKDETTVTHTFDLLKKKGEDNGDGTITWTITINQAKADISGWILEDKLGNEAYTEPVTIKGSNGNIVAYNVKLPYTFPKGSSDTYTVTYTTSHDFSIQNITNKVILKDGNTEVNVLTSVGIGSPITKTGEAAEKPIKDEDGTYLLPITWTVTVDTTYAPIPAGEEFYDKLSGYYGYADMYMTYDQLVEAMGAVEQAIKDAGSSVSYFTVNLFVPGEAVGEYYGASTLDSLLKSIPDYQTQLYERFCLKLGKEIKDKVLTFSYEAYGVFANNLEATSTFKNRFSITNKFEIEASVDYIAERVMGTKYALKYFDPDDPVLKDSYWFWNLTDWNSTEGTIWYDYEKLHDSYLAWAIELSIPPGYPSTKDIVVYEDLPDGVSVKSLKMPFESNKPTTPMEFYDMAPGETYTYQFTLYPADQHGQWNPQGGQTVSITVKVTEDGDLEMTIPGIVLKTMGDTATLENVKEWYAYLYIFTQIDEDFEWPKDPNQRENVYVNAFENRFTIVTEDGDVVDIGSQTQVITKDESKGAIRKEAATEDNIVTYSVLLNAYGKDLVENSNILAIHDELTYTSTSADPLRLRLVPGSVKLYEVRVKSDGSYEKGAEVTANYKYAESPTEADGTTTWVHTIDLTVPDDKPLLLEYSYKANGNKNATHNVSNTCTISGVAEGSINGVHNLELEVKQSSAHADTSGVMIYKVDSQSDGIFLKDAKFHIYIWNQDQNKYIIVNNTDGTTDFITNTSGMIVLDSSLGEEQFAYNTAYYIKEVESPNGYYVSPEPYYFYIAHENTKDYPPCIPPDFTGHALTSGDIIYRQNTSAYTEISIEKYWRNYDGDSIPVTGDKVPSVAVELWQKLENDPGSDTRYGNDTYIMTPDKDGNWSLTIKNLPKATENSDGTRGATYLYYVKEVGVSGYVLESSENNNGINSGTIKLWNRETNGYELPETGGAGITAYRLLGGGMMLMPIPILWRKRKMRPRGRGADGS